jgi:molybdenum cofactor cytidylyltransferase
MKRVSALLLAAGRGKRAHGDKPMLPWGSDNFLTKTYKSLKGVPAFQEVLVVLGHQAFRWTPYLKMCNAHFSINPMFDHGMHSSIKWGLQHLKKDFDLALIALVDQPQLDTADYDYLVSMAVSSGKSLVRPTYTGQSGNPVLIGQKFLSQIEVQEESDSGCSYLFQQNPDEVALVEMPNSKCLIDFDSRESLEAYNEQLIIA